MFIAKSFEFTIPKSKVLEGCVVVGFVLLTILNFNCSPALTDVVVLKLRVIVIILELVDVLEQVREVAKVKVPAHVIVPEGAITSDGYVTSNLSPFVNGEEATMVNSIVVTAPLTKLSGDKATLVRSLTVNIVTITPFVTTSIRSSEAVCVVIEKEDDGCKDTGLVIKPIEKETVDPAARDEVNPPVSKTLVELADHAEVLSTLLKFVQVFAD